MTYYPFTKHVPQRDTILRGQLLPSQLIILFLEFLIFFRVFDPRSFTLFTNCDYSFDYDW
ncbi:Hypothetical protein Nlim_1923 [Candidatus Nitrosarchaeum limnium SFB1]|uniref:Uncharacterized protein n=1 Tax=Candidatus Nitrosarchaeum limnium SFB1 TaxID=886738 RepID=F3KNE0_9ARCH|nr:Hypothetical protein Nlim_1923 [Candidatus Nitrosarchaeum limnium SFB1]